jgi:hypothetical protein
MKPRLPFAGAAVTSRILLQMARPQNAHPEQHHAISASVFEVEFSALLPVTSALPQRHPHHGCPTLF